MAKLITTFDQASFGVNFLIVSPPPATPAAVTGYVGMVAALPWGPTGVRLVSNGSELASLFMPYELDCLDTTTFPSLKALFAGIPGPLYVKNIRAADAVAATRTFNDGSAGPSTVVTAKYAGSLGNKVSVEWVDGTTAGTQATAIVRIGDRYEKTYVDVVSGTTVTDPGDPFVTFSAHGSIAGRPATAAAALLTSGSDGTATAADWNGTSGSLGGVRDFLDSNVALENGVIFGAEVPAAIKAAFNLVIDEVAAEKGAVACLSTVLNETRASAIVTAALSGSTRTDYSGFTVDVVDEYSTALPPAEAEMDTNAFKAAVLAKIGPQRSQGEAALVRPFLKKILRVNATLTDADYELLLAGGVCAPKMTKKGAVFYGGRCTNLTPSTNSLARTRVENYVRAGLNTVLEDAADIVLDVDVTRERLGASTRPYALAATAFLDNLKNPAVGLPVISDYEIDFFASSVAQIQAGTWVIAVAVTSFSTAERIIITLTVGPTVSTNEV